jgi:polyisoprenoid-binding protein YceI
MRLPLASALIVSFWALPATAAPTKPVTYVMADDPHSSTEATFMFKTYLLRFTGRTPKVTGQASVSLDDMARASGKVEVDLASLDTGITLRNDHMRKTLETEKFPTATFKFTGIKLVGNKLAPSQTTSGTATGELTIHGVTRKLEAPIELTYLPELYMAEYKANYRDGKWLHFTTSFPVKFADYGIPMGKPPAGVTMPDGVTIEVAGSARAQ